MRTHTHVHVCISAHGADPSCSHLEPEAVQHRPAALRVPLPTQRRVARAGLGHSVPGCPPAPCRLRALRCAVAPPAGRRRAAPGGWGLPGRPRECVRGLRGAEPPRRGRRVLRGRFLLISSCGARRALLTEPSPSPPPRQLVLFIYAAHKSRVGANVPPPASPARSREPAAPGFPGQTFAGCEVPSFINERRTLRGTFGSV